MIPRLPHPWLPDRFPYEVFAGTGVTPRTSAADLLDAALELQATGAMPPELRAAYDLLRRRADRLATDFFLYDPELCDPTALAREAIELLSRGSEG